MEFGIHYFNIEQGPDPTSEDSTPELYLPTTLRRSFFQNAEL